MSTRGILSRYAMNTLLNKGVDGLRIVGMRFDLVRCSASDAQFRLSLVDADNEVLAHADMPTMLRGESITLFDMDELLRFDVTS